MAKLVRETILVGEITTEMISHERVMTIHDPELSKEEVEKCKASPYYFYTNYFIINGKPATTTLTEQEFNNYFNGNSGS